MHAGVLSASAGRRAPFWAALPAFAALAALGVIAYRTTPPVAYSNIYWTLSGATFTLWSVLGLAALWHDPADRRVRLFALTAGVVSLSLVLPTVNVDWPVWTVAGGLVLAAVAFFANVPIVVHMSSEIPGGNPFVARHPGFIRGNYAAGAALGAAAVAAWSFAAFGTDDPARVADIDRAITVVNRLFYAYAGLAAIGLLVIGARAEARAYRRRQAFVVIVAMAVWTADAVLPLVIPSLAANLIFVHVVEPIVIMLPALALATAVFRFHLFDIGSILRRMLLLEPVSRRFVSAVDRNFFPEKVLLRRLQRTLLTDMAGETTIDGLGRRLVDTLVRDLGAASAVLLVVDDARELFRVRAMAGEVPGGEAARLITMRPGQDMPAALPCETVVRVDFRDEPLALICLGALHTGARLDDDDRDALSHVAQQLSAMIENARLFELASIDSLTGLARRDVFDARLRQEAMRSARTGRPFAVALADVDHFKRINDGHGHRAGDRVLQEVARILSAHSRALDVVARYGGEEFAVLLPETGRAAAVIAAEKLRAAVEAATIDVSGARLHVSISVGVAGSDPAHEGADLVAMADEALYAAKRAGRNQVR